MKNAIVLAAAVILLGGLTEACTSYDYDEEINSRFMEEARLKAEDEKIKAEIVAEVEALNKEIVQNIEAMAQRVDGKLSEKDKEVKGRFDDSEKELKGLIETRAAQAGVKVDELGTTLTNAINQKQVLFDNALMLANQELEKAIKAGDDANIKKAQDAIDLIARTENEVKQACNRYQERINSLLAIGRRLEGMRTEIEKMEAEKARILKQAQDFESEMRKSIDNKIQTFRNSDLAKIQRALEGYNAKLSAYNDLENYAGDLEDLSSEINMLTGNVREAIGNAGDLIDLINSAESELENLDSIYEDMASMYNEAVALFEESRDKVEENLNNIDGDISDLEDMMATLEDYVAEIEDALDYMRGCVDDAESMAGDVDV